MTQAKRHNSSLLTPAARPNTVTAIIVHAFRKLVSPAVFGIPSKQTIIVPVRDDAFAPEICCGEFAIVETTWTEPQDGALVYIRGYANKLRFARLGLLENHPLGPIPTRERPGPFWMERYGGHRVGNWKTSDESWAPGGIA